MISFMVVIKGPVASAGSNFILFRTRGMRVPKTAAKIITENSDRLTVKVRAIFLLMKKL